MSKLVDNGRRIGLVELQDDEIIVGLDPLLMAVDNALLRAIASSDDPSAPARAAIACVLREMREPGEDVMDAAYETYSEAEAAAREENIRRLGKNGVAAVQWLPQTFRAAINAFAASHGIEIDDHTEGVRDEDHQRRPQS